MFTENTLFLFIFRDKIYRHERNTLQKELFMDYNDFEQYTYDRGTYYSSPRWNDFTLDDERRAKKRFSRFFLATFFYIFISYAASIVINTAIALLLGDGADAVFDSSWYALVLNTVAMYVIALPVFYFIVRGMRSAVRAKEKMKLSEFFKIFLVAEAFMTVGNLIGTYLNLFIGAFIGKTPENSTSDMILESNMWLVILIAVIIGPIVEELIFRKLLMDKLGMYGDRLAIFVSAVSFGIFHGNLYQFFYAAMLGFVLAYLYSKTSNVWYPIAIHMTVNFLGSVIPMLLMDKMTRYEELSTLVMSGAEITDAMMTEFTQLSAVVGTYSLASLAISIAGLVIFFKQRRRIFVSDRCEIFIPKERRANVIFANAGVICFLAITGVITILNLLIS